MTEDNQDQTEPVGVGFDEDFAAMASDSTGEKEPVYLREDGAWVPSKSEAFKDGDPKAIEGLMKRNPAPEGYDKAGLVHVEKAKPKAPAKVEHPSEEQQAKDKEEIAEMVGGMDHKMPPKPEIPPFIARTQEYVNEEGLSITELLPLEQEGLIIAVKTSEHNLVLLESGEWASVEGGWPDGVFMATAQEEALTFAAKWDLPVDPNDEDAKLGLDVIPTAIPGKPLPVPRFAAFVTADIPIPGKGVYPQVPIRARFDADSIVEAYVAAREHLQHAAQQKAQELIAQARRQDLAAGGAMPPGAMQGIRG